MQRDTTTERRLQHMLGQRGMLFFVLVATGCTGYDIPIQPGIIYANDGGPDGGTGPDVVQPPSCDPVADPKDSPTCVADSFGVFVSTEAGSAGNPGTKGSPVGSINQALTMAAQQGKSRVYICGTGKIDEQVQLSSAVSLYGGFLCSTWEYNSGASNKAHIAPSARGPALTLTGLSRAVTIADLSFEAQSAVDAGESSVAVISNQSTATFTRCDLKAGNGQSGKDGAPGPSNYDAAVIQSGNPANGGNGGAAQTCVCKDGTQSTGGIGGGVSMNGTNGTPNNGGGMGGVASTASTACGAGGHGGDGAAGKSGTSTPGPGSVGTVMSSYGTCKTDGTWLPALSNPGTLGGVGQGGGGGGGGAGSSSGGGGGCGGCGGSPGGAAQAGGASIALISFKSQVTLHACTLTAGQAGNGGKGAPGQVGQAGGDGGVGSWAGCAGGAGGKGGDGGASAGGAGGIAAGILWGDGQAPSVDSLTTITTGVGGSAGAGGAANNAGLDGVTGTILQINLAN